MAVAPLEAADRLAAEADRRTTDRERFVGYGLMGQTFASGHVLGLRHWLRSSVGPPYTSVWHRAPDGTWAFWSTEAAEVSCTRYTSAIAADVRHTGIDVNWASDRNLMVAVPEVGLRWSIHLTSTPLTKALSGVASRSGGLLRRPPVLRHLGGIAGRMLGAGRLALAGDMPNGQDFRLVPSRLWLVDQSTASLSGVGLGPIGPLKSQATIGGFRIPQRGLLAVGTVDFAPG